jgi:hypothetical protein
VMFICSIGLNFPELFFPALCQSVPSIAKAVPAASHFLNVEWENANPNVFQVGDNFMHDFFHAAWTRGSGAKCAEFRPF